ncbi:MAG: DUF2089 domain-containing protein [Clostridiales bacterium]|jgi:hypothetical protein|nr:DUF2089 domain-containing protein [Clostridiales bacterium]
MKHKTIVKCPFCGEPMLITRLKCSKCETEITGNFTQCKYCMLDEKNLNFMEVFLKNRGSIKDVERELGVSYPTVRNMLDELLKELDLKLVQEDHFTEKEILEKLGRHEITAAEASELLKDNIKKKGNDTIE